MSKNTQKEIATRLNAIRDGSLNISAKEQFKWIMEMLPKDKIAFNAMKCTMLGKEHIAYPIIVPGQIRKYWADIDIKDLEEAAKSVGGFITIGDKDFPIVEFRYPIESKKVLSDKSSKESILTTSLSTFS